MFELDKLKWYGGEEGCRQLLYSTLYRFYFGPHVLFISPSPRTFNCMQYLGERTISSNDWKIPAENKPCACLLKV
jgi:hypothetical protein